MAAFDIIFTLGIISAAALVLIVLASSVFVVRQWERVAVLRLGRIVKVHDAGVHLRIPLLDRLFRVDMRIQTIDLSGQKAITSDNISIGVDAAVFARVDDPEKVITRVRDYRELITKYSQTTLRNVVGTFKLNELLSEKEAVAGRMKEQIDHLMADVGIDVPDVGIQDISLPEDMRRAFAVQAEAQRSALAVITRSEAELKASEMLKLAAENLKDPNAMQLRILTVIADVSKEQSNTIVLALPLETFKALDMGDIAALSSVRPEHI